MEHINGLAQCGQKPLQALLDTINTPRDLKALSMDQLVELAEEIRTFIIRSVSQTGGHLASKTRSRRQT